MTEHVELWMVPARSQLQWHSWGDAADAQFVVFNPSSGETHCLNFVAALILQYLEERPYSVDALAAEIRKAIPEGTEAGALVNFAGLLQEFDEIGLIAPVRP